jgi:hypothetical protein
MDIPTSKWREWCCSDVLLDGVDQVGARGLFGGYMCIKDPVSQLKVT